MIDPAKARATGGTVAQAINPQTQGKIVPLHFVPDKIDAHLEGEKLGREFLDEIANQCANGDELAQAVHRITGATNAKLRGFCRTLQKALEARQ